MFGIVRLPGLKYSLLALLFLPAMMKAQEEKSVKQELELIFKDIRPADRKELIDNSVNVWNSAFFTESEKENVGALFQSLRDLRVAVNPELKNFVQSVNAFGKRNEKENLNVWLNGLKKALEAAERKKTVVKDYLVSTAPVVCDHILYSGAGHKWFVRGACKWSASAPVRLDFADADLVCATPKDTVIIRGTNVGWEMNADKARGKGGVVNWKNTQEGLKADISSYTVDMKISEYTADSVLFRYESKYGRPILGRLKDNASKFDRGKNRPYPEFTSYAMDIKLDSLFPDLSYQGGITYAGVKLSGFGSEEKPACLHVSPNDTINMYLYSTQFLIDSMRVVSGNAALNIDMKSGKIVHPGLNFAYTAPNHTVMLKRISDQSLHQPFKDSYHKILFDMEQVEWPLDSNHMKFSMSSRSGLIKAVIESENFFSDDVYDDIQGMDEVNPLNGLLRCAAELKSDVFTVADYASFIKKPADQLRKQVLLLSYKDFLTYDETKDQIALRQRLFDYTKARVGKQDYDNIRFVSHPKTKENRVNALLDVRNFSFRIFGVEKFTISEAKDVYVEPSDKSVMMYRNRDMAFNGKLKAGMFDMYGNNLFFSYDNYTINLAKVDSTGMYLENQVTHKRGERVNSLIRDISGNIVIDKPDNKSGKKENENFPVLNSTKESYVYFDAPDIQNGNYKRDSFYYVIKPYAIRGINNGANFRYAFNGTLVSNILPPIADTLRLMKDKTLGMNYNTPAAGLKLYGEGNLKGSVVLNHKGFTAKADVDLNQSAFRSDTILMLPKQMRANTDMLVVRAVSMQRPEAKGERVRLKYLSDSGNLQATSTVKPFDAYKNRVKHSGTLFVYKNLLDADGQLTIGDAAMQSKLFNLQADNILSAHAGLTLSSVTNSDIQLNTPDVQANVDLAADKGKFVNNTETNKAQFSSNRYACSFKSFTWYMKEAYLNIGIEDTNELNRIWKIENTDDIPEQGRNIFVSTDRRTDSLSFIAPLAKYNLKTGLIDCHWINHLDVANGRFYPDKGDVFVSDSGNIREFTGGRLLCERSGAGKLLTDVTFKLKGRYQFSGSGNYDYVSEEKKTSVIRFSELGTDTARLIYAKATITPEKPLLLNDGLSYKGTITLYSQKTDFFYKGFVGLTADDTYLKHNWFAVDTYFQFGRVRVPVQIENRDDKNQRIFNGIFLNVDKTIRPYAAFQSNRAFYNDDLLIGGKGELAWLGKEKRYVICDTAVDKYYNYCYHPETSTVSAFGQLGVAITAPGVYQNATGDISYDLKEEKLGILNMLYLVDFSLLSKMESALLKDFTDKKVKTIGHNSSLFAKLYSIYGKAAMPEVSKQLARSSNNLPDSLDRLFVFDSLDFQWDEKNRSYVSDGKAKLLAIRHKPVDREMDMAMEIVRRKGRDELFIYIYSDKIWYYFEYSGGVLYTLSSNAEYNTILQNEKADKKIVQTKEKATLYTITLCPDSKRQRFLKRMGK